MIKRSVLLCLLVTLCALTARPQSTLGRLEGQVVDPQEAVIVGATVTAVSEQGVETSVVTNGAGGFEFKGLAPGKYTLRASSPGFVLQEQTGVEVDPKGAAMPVKIVLHVELESQRVDVMSDSALSTASDKNAGAFVLSGKDLDALPDDPDELRAALMALAGPASGPDGGQLFVDGFAGGRLPPKESIREIRINQNPFSAEYERMGFGRVEVFTKPGSQAGYRGQASLNFNDESMNARHPFVASRAPFQSRLFNANLGGPLVRQRASFFVDFQRREIDDNAFVNATVLTPSFTPTRLTQTVLTPQRFTNFSPRFDLQANPRHTLVGRYSFSRWSFANVGVGERALPERASDRTNRFQMLQLSETAVLSASMINELRFQFTRANLGEEADSSAPSIQVLDSFNGGGPQLRRSTRGETGWDLNDIVSVVHGKHYARVGGRLRGVRVDEMALPNPGGTYTFAGGFAPSLDADGRAVLDPSNGLPVLVPITSLERYRRTQFFLSRGLAPAEVRALGGGASQFSVVTGDPEASVSQTDFALFAQDEWRLRSNLSLSLGLRYEGQSNIKSNFDLAPRAGLAWAPGSAGARQPHTVVRAGAGIYFERFDERLTLDANRFDGSAQQRFIVSAADPAGRELLDSFPVPPSAAAFAAFAPPQTLRRVAGDLRTPYTIQTVLSVERLLPYKVTLTASFIYSRTLHALRSRSLAPQADEAAGGRIGHVFLYESSGRINQKQLILNATKRFSSEVSFYASYVLNKALGDTDGPGDFPADSLDAGVEYGRTAFDIRQRFVLGGSLKTLWGLSLNPFVNASSGRPFNITTGRDLNGDTLFNERPALGGDSALPGVVVTSFGTFDTTPAPGRLVIPRNFGSGPAFLAVSLGVSRTFRFMDKRGSDSAPSGQAAGQAASPLGGFFSKASAEKRFELTLTLRAQNIFNRTNLDVPVGNLSSPFFGQSTQTVGAFGSGGNTSGGNRRIEAQVRLAF